MTVKWKSLNDGDFLPSQVTEIPQTSEGKTAEDMLIEVRTASTKMFI
jgi:hypothetical protein